MSQALTDILIIDAGGTVSTTYCAKLFADYGATVVNLEPNAGMPTRKLAPYIDHPDCSSAMHAYLNANKHSVQLEALTEQQIDSLVAKADLVLDGGNFQRAKSAKLSMSITWYGESGPYADFHGSDAQCFALNGMLRTIGHEAGPPLIPTGYQAQIVGGMTAFIGAMGQVLAREINPGQPNLNLETSIYEAMLCFTEVGTITAYNTGLEGSRIGINRFPPTYPLGVFPCKDGWIGLTVLTPGQWHTFCDLLDLGDFKNLPLFQTAIGRLEAADMLEPMICERLLKLSSEELFYQAQNAGVPLARVPTMEELAGVDQYAQRNAFAEINLGHNKVLNAPTIPFRLFSTPPRLGGTVAPMGAHNEHYQND